MSRGFLLFAIGFFLVVLVAIFIRLPQFTRSRGAVAEDDALISVQAISEAAESYAAKYASGFPPNLEVLGPPQNDSDPSCDYAGLVDVDLADGEKGVYRFLYRAGPTVQYSNNDCPLGVTSYSVVARPVEYERPATIGFYSDESGVVRFTLEDRPATAEDPVLQRTP